MKWLLGVSLAAVAAASLSAAAPCAFAAAKKGPPGSPAASSVPSLAHPGITAALEVEGIVQSFAPDAVVVKQLDGRALTIVYDAKTKIVVDGNPGKIDEAKTGYILVARWAPGKPARLLRFVRPS